MYIFNKKYKFTTNLNGVGVTSYNTDMEFTCITKDNYMFFSPLLCGLRLSGERLFTGAVRDGKPVGVAVFSAYADVLFLDYLYVPKALRRQGIAKALLNASLEEIRKVRDVPVHAGFPDYREDIFGFFKALDYRYLRDGVCFASKLSTWLGSKRLKALISKVKFGDVISMADLAFSEWEELEGAIKKEDIDPQILHQPELDPGISCVEMDVESGLPEACVLIEKRETTLALLLVGNFSHQPEDLLALFSMLLEQLPEELSEDSDLYFVTMDEGMKKLAEKLADDPAEIKILGSVVSCTDGRTPDAMISAEDTMLQKSFADPGKMEVLADSWLLESRTPKEIAEALDPEEGADVFQIRSFSRSQLIKRGLKFLRKAERQNRLLSILRSMPEETTETGEDLSVFEYMTDNEFLDKLPVNYPLLKKLVKEKTEDEKRAAMIGEIEENYETQIMLMRSPYYLLLGAKNTSKFSEAHLQDIRKNIEAERAMGKTVSSFPDVDRFISYCEKFRREDIFGKGKKVRI